MGISVGMGLVRVLLDSVTWTASAAGTDGWAASIFQKTRTDVGDCTSKRSAGAGGGLYPVCMYAVAVDVVRV